MDPIQIVRDIGIPAALLLGIGWGGWQITQWLGSEVIKPAVARLFQFLDKLETAVDQISLTMEKVVNQQAEMVSHVERISSMGCAYKRGER